MKLITKEIKRLLDKNKTLPEKDRKPYLKLFNAYGQGTWLISEIDENDILFGLCDLGFGCPEFGYVALSELVSMKMGVIPMIERDMYFEPNTTLDKYWSESISNGVINA